MIQMKNRNKKRKLIAGGIILAVALVVTISVVTIKIVQQRSTQSIIQSTGYTTVLPEGKSIIQLGGWKRVSPEKSTPVYAYNDTLKGVAISVSQQPLPDSFKGSVGNSVANLAKSYNAVPDAQVGDMVIYIGTSSKGPQSVIFTKEGLLILIKSEKKIENTAWSDYAVSLR